MENNEKDNGRSVVGDSCQGGVEQEPGCGVAAENVGMPDIPPQGVLADGVNPREKVVCPYGTWEKLAKFVSALLNPLVMPFYFIIILLYGRTLMYYLPVRTKIFFLFAVLLNTLVVPMFFIGFMKSTGYVKSVSLKEREDRIIPLIVTAFCYAICAYMINDLMVAFIVKRVLVAGAVCILFAAAVTYFWKISLHMIAMGGGLAILILITMSKIGSLQPWVIAHVIGTGIVASARLYLGSHNMVQIAAGFFSGFIISSVIMLFG